MKFDQAIDNAARALNAAASESDTDRAGPLLALANTWVRVVELIHCRNADPAACEL
jgi:hypothetical protein